MRDEVHAIVVHKTWTQAGSRYLLIWTMLNSIGEMISCSLSLDQV